MKEFEELIRDIAVVTFIKTEKWDRSHLMGLPVYRLEEEGIYVGQIFAP